jgi:hypothetical protein
MRLIPTARKEKLPEGFSYPLGAESISEALDTVPPLQNATIWFNWRDEYWASSWRKKMESLGSFKLLEVGASPLSGEPVLRVYSVPSEYSLVAREHLLAELPRVRRQLLAGGRVAREVPIRVTLNLSEAEAAANPQDRANRRRPVRSGTKRRSAAAASGRSPRFAQLLPPKRPGAEGIELARAMLAAMGVTEERLRGNADRN